MGPYRIIHINDDPKTCVLEHLNSNTIRRAHITHLRQFVPGKVPNNLTEIPNNNEAIKVLKQYQGHTYNLRPRLQNIWNTSTPQKEKMITIELRNNYLFCATQEAHIIH